jgi:hypothetical protein
LDLLHFYHFVLRGMPSRIETLLHSQQMDAKLPSCPCPLLPGDASAAWGEPGSLIFSRGRPGDARQETRQSARPPPSSPPLVPRSPPPPSRLPPPDRCCHKSPIDAAPFQVCALPSSFCRPHLLRLGLGLIVGCFGTW